MATAVFESFEETLANPMLMVSMALSSKSVDLTDIFQIVEMMPLPQEQSDADEKTIRLDSIERAEHEGTLKVTCVTSRVQLQSGWTLWRASRAVAPSQCQHE